MLKDKNGKDLSEAEEIKKRWQEYTRELYKKGLNDPDNHDGVATQCETIVTLPPGPTLHSFRIHYQIYTN